MPGRAKARAGIDVRVEPAAWFVRGRQLSESWNESGTAAAYAALLLRSLGQRCVDIHVPSRHPAIAWARSGAMALTGSSEAEPRMCPVALASCADAALAALASLAPAGSFGQVDGAALLGERAAVAGFSRAGLVSSGGACRLLEARDGWLAVNFPRESDWELAPAWLEINTVDDWSAVAARLRDCRSAELVERARLMGLAVSAEVEPADSTPPWFRQTRLGAQRARGAMASPLVIDLSTLWAGPLCGHLLQQLGATVVKLESQARPDGARFGPEPFFDLLNAGKSSVALDPKKPAQREALLALMHRADIVIESTRPRALAQFGIDAAAVLRESPGLSWVSISGYGRSAPHSHWAAFGDDAGVAAGLSWLLDAAGSRAFCADAIADPLTGLHAALAAWSDYLGGGGHLIALSLRDVVAHCAGFDRPRTRSAIRARASDWSRLAAAAGGAAPPRARRAQEHAPALGADTRQWTSRLGVAC